MSSETQWPEVRLGDYTTVKARLGWKGLKADEYVEDGYIFLATPNLKGHQIDFHNVDYITKWRYDESPEIQLRLGDVLIVKDGSTLGICNFVRRLPRPTTVNGSIAVVRTSDSLDSEFLFHFVNGDDFQKLITLKKSGLGVPHLFQADLRDFPVSLPSLPEQKKIARILTTLDNLIEKTEALIAKYQAIKQGMMHDLFTRGVDEHGQLRPTQQQAPDLYKQSELGWIPKDWEADQVENVLQRIIDYRGKTPSKTSNGIPLITAKNIRKGYIDDEPREFIAESDYRTWMTRGIPEKGDVLFTTEAPLGNVAQLETDEKRAFAQRVIILQCGKRMVNDFLKYRLMTDEVQSRIGTRGTGSTVEGIKQSEFRLVWLSFPTSTTEQAVIASRTQQLDSQIRSEQRHLSKLKTIKSGLMQDLLTGKVRVNVDEAEEVAAHA